MGCEMLGKCIYVIREDNLPLVSNCSVEKCKKAPLRDNLMLCGVQDTANVFLKLTLKQPAAILGQS